MAAQPVTGYRFRTLGNSSSYSAALLVKQDTRSRPRKRREDDGGGDEEGAVLLLLSEAAPRSPLPPRIDNDVMFRVCLNGYGW